ncbi:M1 family metallopeptidase [Actinoplanes sp. RD1]|uniref:M1 family metallopeptidase n=1 Tax=Actinoplanes sp. RD1 TaxID=3064538 RepID=UPI0027404822|nr:M1 family metallopeptidase [Actinoplanes sp. RD1]
MAAVVLALAGCSAGDTPAADAPAAPAVTPTTGPVAGSAGLGDGAFPALGNGGYDVRKYALKLRVDPARRRLSGTATITATATEELKSFFLDLSRLRVSSVTVNGRPAADAVVGAKLAVTPRASLPADRPFTIVVHYGGALVPGDRTVTEPGRIPVRQLPGGFYTPTAPASASSWFPANDHPSDKAAFAVELSVPEGVAAVSNGMPGERSTRDKRTTWRWSESGPMAPSAAFLLVGRYQVSTLRHAGKPMVVAVPAGSAHQPALDRAAKIADWLARRFGPYPFSSYGAVVLPDPYAARGLPAQTRPAFSATALGRPTGPAAVAEGLAGQWFGASVTPRTWEDAWLATSFARYARWMWTEHDGGATVEAEVSQRYETFPWQAFPAYAPGRADALDSEMAADRGAMTLHALRRRIGDTAFFALLRSWTASRAYGTATTADFVAAAERASGQDLDRFFDVWLTGPYRPTY